MTLVERGPKGAKARSFHVNGTKASDLPPIIKANVHPRHARLTDELVSMPTWASITEHDFVTHSTGEYVRGIAQTNTVEGVYIVFKRGMKGIYQHCSERHLQPLRCRIILPV